MRRSMSMLHRETPIAARVDVVGPEPMTTDALTASMRRWLGLAPAPIVRLPRWMLGAVTRLKIGPVTRESLTMLEGGALPIAATGLVPATLDVALARTPATDVDRLAARLMPLAPLLRWLLAIVWLAGGIVPLALTPAATNIELLARSGDLAARRIVNRNVVIADWLFTTPAVIVQPVTGVWLARIAGYPLTTGWLAAAIMLYLFVGACWLPVVGIQIEMRRIVDREALPARYFKLSRTWFVLGWPAFAGVLVIFWLMVAKPDFAW